YFEPSIYTGNAVATTMYSTVNSTHFTWTFRFKNCATWTGSSTGATGFKTSADFTVMGWSLALSGTTNPSDPNSAIIQHDKSMVYS
ncbi:hypothetical protein L211DRAFT_784131, partial [Terfezia boudieri ATCC MYA-4762]